MRWWRRVALGLLALAVALAVAVWAFMPAVNVALQPLLAASLPAWFAPPAADARTLAGRIRLPPGFTFTVYAANIRGARMLRFTRAGDLLVAVPGEDSIQLLERDRDGDGVADGSRVLLAELDGPNGLDFHQQWLYVAEQGRVGRLPFDHASGTVTGPYQLLIGGLPTGGNHWKKTIRFGPDGRLYLTIGSSCNACVEADPRRATMMRFEADGSGGLVYASGLRNSAGFDWRPADGVLFATDNGRDLLGDDFPPCELNRIEQGGFHGWPFANGSNEPDPDYGSGREVEIARATPPVFGFRAHNAPLGIVFPRNGALPAAYRDAALVALHGSWNRRTKDGYKVVSLHFSVDGSVEERDFMTGFLAGDQVIGRPAELTEGADGAIYIADDYAGAVYRVAAPGQAPGAAAAVPVAAGPAVEVARPAPVLDDALIAKGAVLFTPCLTCHAAAAGGTDRVPLGGLSARYDVASLAALLAHPQAPMPPVDAAEARTALAHFLLENYR